MNYSNVTKIMIEVTPLLKEIFGYNYLFMVIATWAVFDFGYSNLFFSLRQDPGAKMETMLNGF